MNDSNYYYTYTLYLSYNENIQQFSGIREWVIQIYLEAKMVLYCKNIKKHPKLKKN